MASSALGDSGGDPRGVRAGVPGAQLDQGGAGAGGQQQRRAGREGADVGGFEDVLAAQGDLLARSAVAVAGRADRDVVLADQGGQVTGQARVVDPGADDLAGRRAPQRGHARLAPDGHALLVGLQDRDRHHATRAEVAVQVGQVGDAADVGGLVQDQDHRRVEPAAGHLGVPSAARMTMSVSAAISGDAAARDSVSRYKVSRDRPANACRAEDRQRLPAAG